MKIKHQLLGQLATEISTLFQIKSSRELTSRFYLASANPQVASICGTSEMSANSKGEKLILDASAASVGSGDKSAYLPIASIVADALGESEDQQDNKNNAAISQYFSEALSKELVELGKPLTEEEAVKILNKVAHNAKQRNAANKEFGFKYFASTALNALYYDDQRQTASFIQAGDTIALVFDGKTGAVKFQMPARVYKEGDNIWAPVPAQLLAHSTNKLADFAKLTLQYHQQVVEPGDIIVQMTDGIWSEFPSDTVEVNSEETQYLQSKLSINSIFDLMGLKNNNKHLEMSSEQIARHIHQNAMANAFSFCKDLQEIHDVLSKALEKVNEKELLIEEFLKTRLDERTSQVFRRLFLDKDHDGISCALDMPVIYFKQKFKHLTFGDCATLSVVKIPDGRLQLLKALLENKEDARSCIGLLEKAALEADLQTFYLLLEQLQEEHITSLPVVALDKLAQNTKRVVNDAQIEFLRNLLTDFVQLKEYIAQNKPLQAQNRIAKHLSTLPDQQYKAYLISVIQEHDLINCHISCDINSPWRCSPLFTAIASNKPGVITALIQLGSDVNEKNAQGLTPLHCAIHKGSMELVLELLKCGAPLAPCPNKQHRVMTGSQKKQNKNLDKFLRSAEKIVALNGDAQGIREYLSRLIQDYQSPPVGLNKFFRQSGKLGHFFAGKSYHDSSPLTESLVQLVKNKCLSMSELSAQCTQLRKARQKNNNINLISSIVELGLHTLQSQTVQSTSEVSYG